MKLLRVTVEWWICVTARVSTPTERATPTGNCTIGCGLCVIVMCPRGSVHYYITLVQDIRGDNEGSCPRGGQEACGKSLYLPPSLAVNLKLPLKSLKNEKSTFVKLVRSE